MPSCKACHRPSSTRGSHLNPPHAHAACGTDSHTYLVVDFHALSSHLIAPQSGRTHLLLYTHLLLSPCTSNSHSTLTLCFFGFWHAQHFPPKLIPMCTTQFYHIVNNIVLTIQHISLIVQATPPFQFWRAALGNSAPSRRGSARAPADPQTVKLHIDNKPWSPQVLWGNGDYAEEPTTNHQLTGMM